jgi:hypothetical protein
MAPSPTSRNGNGSDRTSQPAIDPSFTRYLDVQVLAAARCLLLRGASPGARRVARE